MRRRSEVLSTSFLLLLFHIQGLSGRAIHPLGTFVITLQAPELSPSGPSEVQVVVQEQSLSNVNHEKVPQVSIPAVKSDTPLDIDTALLEHGQNKPETVVVLIVVVDENILNTSRITSLDAEQNPETGDDSGGPILITATNIDLSNEDRIENHEPLSMESIDSSSHVNSSQKFPLFNIVIPPLTPFENVNFFAGLLPYPKPPSTTAPVPPPPTTAAPPPPPPPPVTPVVTPTTPIVLVPTGNVTTPTGTGTPAAGGAAPPPTTPARPPPASGGKPGAGGSSKPLPAGGGTGAGGGRPSTPRPPAGGGGGGGGAAPSFGQVAQALGAIPVLGPLFSGIGGLANIGG